MAFFDRRHGRIAGLCDFETRTITTTEVVCRESLVVFLHEVTHAELHDVDNQPICPVMEYEAETGAHRKMRAEGYAVPRAALDSGRAYVRAVIDAHDGPVPAYVRRWAKHGEYGE